MTLDADTTSNHKIGEFNKNGLKRRFFWNSIKIDTVLVTRKPRNLKTISITYRHADIKRDCLKCVHTYPLSGNYGNKLAYIVTICCGPVLKRA